MLRSLPESFDALLHLWRQRAELLPSLQRSQESCGVPHQITEGVNILPRNLCSCLLDSREGLERRGTHQDRLQYLTRPFERKSSRLGHGHCRQDGDDRVDDALSGKNDLLTILDPPRRQPGGRARRVWLLFVWSRRRDNGCRGVCPGTVRSREFEDGMVFRWGSRQDRRNSWT
jgi:hypothetical protein